MTEHNRPARSSAAWAARARQRTACASALAFTLNDQTGACPETHELVEESALLVEIGLTRANRIELMASVAKRAAVTRTECWPDADLIGHLIDRLLDNLGVPDVTPPDDDTDDDTDPPPAAPRVTTLASLQADRAQANADGAEEEVQLVAGVLTQVISDLGLSHDLHDEADAEVQADQLLTIGIARDNRAALVEWCASQDWHEDWSQRIIDELLIALDVPPTSLADRRAAHVAALAHTHAIAQLTPTPKLDAERTHRRKLSIAACAGLPEEVGLCEECQSFFTIETGWVILTLTDAEFEDADSTMDQCDACANSHEDPTSTTGSGDPTLLLTADQCEDLSHRILIALRRSTLPTPIAFIGDLIAAMDVTDRAMTTADIDQIEACCTMVGTTLHGRHDQSHQLTATRS